MIWRSRWITAGSVTECHEALAFPGDPGRAVVLRQIVARDCPAEIEVVLDLRAGFGQRGLRSVKRDEHGTWNGRAGDLHVRWSGDVAEARVHRAGQASVLAMNLPVPPGDSRDLILELAARAAAGWAARRHPVVERHAGTLGAGRAAAGRDRRRAGCPAGAGGAARADQRRRRDGRGRHHQPARTGRGGAQLRLPVRLDPGPGLRRPRGGRRGLLFPARRRRAVHLRPAARRRPEAGPGLHRRRRPRARPAPAQSARLSGRVSTWSATG